MKFNVSYTVNDSVLPENMVLFVPDGTSEKKCNTICTKVIRRRVPRSDGVYTCYNNPKGVLK
jgi:hypothetical protein